MIVVNEFGGVEGLVSTDDVFDFLTHGEAIHLHAPIGIAELEKGVYRCAGLTPISALHRAANLPLEADARVSTVGGLVMALMKRVPQPGDEVADAGLVYRVISMKDLLIDRVLIAPEGHPILSAAAEVAA